MKLRDKVIVGFLVIAIAGWIMGGFGLVNNKLMGAKAAKQEEIQQSCMDAAHVLTAHYNWRHNLTMSVSFGEEFTGSLDPNTCALGTWLNSGTADTDDETIRGLIEAVKIPHSYIHEQAETVKELVDKGDKAKAQRIFYDEILPKTNETIKLLQQIEDRYAVMMDDNMQGIITLQNITLIEMLLLFIAVVVVSIIFIRRTLSAVMPPLVKLTEAADRLTLGHLDIESNYEIDDEIGHLFRSFKNLTESMRQQAEALDRLAAGDYTVSVDMRSEDDRVNKAIQTLASKTSETLLQVQAVSSQVSIGAEQIAQASTNLATGSTEQAATIEEFSGRIDRVQLAAASNAEQATAAFDGSQEVSTLMKKSMDDMSIMLEAMSGISDMSKEIGHVIKVIDDIAFQTNILALNASVEAARAGQHGKGFAVVAEEVRNLAAKSAEAAKETAALIEKSSANVNKGNIIVKRVNEGLRAVDELAIRNAGSVENINNDSHRQSEMMEEINVGMAQISSVVQLNSATAEETAAAAQEMSAQAEILDESVNRFKLRHNKTY